jgi:hypothetical protein
MMMYPDEDDLSPQDEALWTEISAAVKETHRDGLRNTVRQSITTAIADAHHRRRRRLLVTGLLLLAIGLLITCYLFSRSQPQEVASRFFEPEFDITIQRSAAAQDSLFWYYKQAQATGNYTAMRHWLQSHRPAENSSAYTLNLAQVWLLSGEPDSAMVLLSAITHQSQFKKEWLISLAHLIAGRHQEAILILQGIEQTTGPYQSRARDLLREINQ